MTKTISTREARIAALKERQKAKNEKRQANKNPNEKLKQTCYWTPCHLWGKKDENGKQVKKAVEMKVK